MMKTRCIKARRDIAAWLDLPEPERQRLRQHAQECADCRGELDGTLAVLEHLEAGRETYTELRYTGPPPSLHDSQALTTAASPEKDHWSNDSLPDRRFWRPLPVALAAGLSTVSLAVYLLNVGQPPTPAPNPAPQTQQATSDADIETPQASMARPPAIRPAAASASLEAIRRAAHRAGTPTAPKRPSGFTLRLPNRPVPPKSVADQDQDQD